MENKGSIYGNKEANFCVTKTGKGIVLAELLSPGDSGTKQSNCGHPEPC